MNLKLIVLIFCPLLSFGQKTFIPDRTGVYDCTDGHFHSSINSFEPGIWAFQNTYITDIVIMGEGKVTVILENDITVVIESNNETTIYKFINSDLKYSKEYISKFKVKSINSYNKFMLCYLYE